MSYRTFVLLSARHRRLPRGARPAFAAAAFFAMGGLARAAPADDRPTFTWQGPPECDEFTAVSEQLTQLADGQSAPVHADARIERGRGTDWQLHLRTRKGSEEGERVISAESCSALAAATTAVLTVMLSTDVEPPAPEPLVVAPPSPSVRAFAPSGAERPALSSTANRGGQSPVFIALGGVGDTGTLPGASFGFGALAGFDWHRVRFEGAATYLPGADAVMPAGAAHVSLISVGARTCLRIPAEWLGSCAATVVDVFSCAGVEGGTLRGSGYAMVHPADSSAPWLAGAMTLESRFPAHSRVGLRLDASAVVPFLRTTFAIDSAPLHTPSFLVGRLGLSGEVRFP